MRPATWLIGTIAVGVSVVLGGTTASAHHAFAAEFSAEHPVHFSEATITKVEWINPHAWFHVDVKQPNGEVESWMIEAGNPFNLFRRGFSRDVITVGMVVTIDGYQATDGSNRANGRDMRLPDGRTLFMGSSGTGAPTDGRDPTDR